MITCEHFKSFFLLSRNGAISITILLIHKFVNRVGKNTQYVIEYAKRWNLNFAAADGLTITMTVAKRLTS